MGYRRLPIKTTASIQPGKPESEGRATLGLVVDRQQSNGAAVAFDDSFAHRQSDPRARIIIATVQSLKNDENLGGIIDLDADAIVFYEYTPEVTFGFDTDMHCRSAITFKLDCIAE